MPKSLWAPMRAVLNTTVVEAPSLANLSAERWHMIAYRDFTARDWDYVFTDANEVAAFEAMRHLKMLALTQRRSDGYFVLLAKVARDMEASWPAVLKNELNKIRRRK